MSILVQCLVGEGEGAFIEVERGVAGGVVDALIIIGPLVEGRSFQREGEGEDSTEITVTPRGVKKGPYN